MSISLGPKDKDQILRVGVISAAVLAVVGYGYYELRTPDVPPATAPPVIINAPSRTSAGTGPTTGPVSRAVRAGADANTTGAANKVGTTASQYDPTLKMESMLVTESLVYSGSGRNIFSTSSAPINVPIPVPKASVRTGVVLPVYQPPPGPAPPPPIDLKFFGTATRADGTRQAFLLHGEDVFLASPGSIVQRRYKVGAVQANSVEIEDLTNNNKQTLQLQRN